MIEVLIAATVAITFIFSQTYAEDIKTAVRRTPPPTDHSVHPQNNDDNDDDDNHHYTSSSSENDFLSNWIADGNSSDDNLTGFSTGEDKK